jgi:hypothetical protein
VVKKNIESTKIKILLTKIIHNYEVQFTLHHGFIDGKSFLAHLDFGAALDDLQPFCEARVLLDVDCQKDVQGSDDREETVISYGDGVSYHILFFLEEGVRKGIHLTQAFFVVVVKTGFDVAKNSSLDKTTRLWYY